jgi:hypothetical protein
MEGDQGSFETRQVKSSITGASFGRVNNQQGQTSGKSKVPATNIKDGNVTGKVRMLKVGKSNRITWCSLHRQYAKRYWTYCIDGVPPLKPFNPRLHVFNNPFY